MTTLVAFDPNSQQPSRFLASLDFQVYSCITPWNFFGKRRYLSIQTSGGELIVLRALVGSPIGYPIKSLTWNNGRAYVTTLGPHTYPFMATTDLTISECAPAALNGSFQCFVTGRDTFEYQLPTPVNNVTQFGRVDYNVDLAGPYFTSSTLAFREATGNIEVNP